MPSSRWDAFTTPELRQLASGDVGPDLEAEIAGAFEGRIETLAGASPPQGEAPDDDDDGRAWRFCPHPFGWSYNTHRRRRWCRVCAYQQRLDADTGEWIAAR